MIESLSGVAVGAVLTAIFTFYFQKKLLNQQLQSNKESHKELLEAVDKFSDGAIKRLERMANSVSRMADKWPPSKPDSK